MGSEERYPFFAAESTQRPRWWIGNCKTTAITSVKVVRSELLPNINCGLSRRRVGYSIWCTYCMATNQCSSIVASKKKTIKHFDRFSKINMQIIWKHNTSALFYSLCWYTSSQMNISPRLCDDVSGVEELPRCRCIRPHLQHRENMRKLQAYRNVRKCQKMSKNVKKCQKIFKIQKFTRDKLENQVSSSPSLQVSRLWSRANEPARGVRQENLLGHDACDVAVRKHW